MDHSKLPRMSRTPGQQPDDDGPPPRVVYVERGEVAGPSGWLSLIIGAVLLLMYPRLWTYLSHVLFGTAFRPFEMPDGTTVPYTSTVDIWSDLAIALFAVAMVVEGIVLVAAPRSRAALLAATALAAVATVGNALFLLYSLTSGGDLAIVSLLATLFGGWMTATLWRLARAVGGERVELAEETP